MDTSVVLNALRNDRPGAVTAVIDACCSSWRADDKAAADAVLDGAAELAAAGSRSAVEVLVTVTDRLKLHGTAIRQVLVRADDIEEAMQRTLFAVARGAGSFRSGAKFRTWLYTVARNEALQVVRAHSRQPQVEEYGEDEPGGFVARMSSVIASQQVIYRAIEDLPEPFRMVVVLRDIEQLEYKEIADRLGIEIGTVSSRVARGRALVREALTGFFEPPRPSS